MAYIYEITYHWSKDANGILPEIPIKVVEDAIEVTVEQYGITFTFLHEVPKRNTDSGVFHPYTGANSFIKTGIVRTQPYSIQDMYSLFKTMDAVKIRCNQKHPELDVTVFITKAYDWETILHKLAQKGKTRLSPSECLYPRIPLCFEWDGETFEADCLFNSMFHELITTLVKVYSNEVHLNSRKGIDKQ